MVDPLVTIEVYLFYLSKDISTIHWQQRVPLFPTRLLAYYPRLIVQDPDNH